MRRCVWSRNLKNEEAMARVGPQRHRNIYIYIYIYIYINSYYFPNSVNKLVSIIEASCVVWEEGTEFSCIIQINFRLESVADRSKSIINYYSMKYRDADHIIVWMGCGRMIPYAYIVLHKSVQRRQVQDATVFALTHRSDNSFSISIPYEQLALIISPKTWFLAAGCASLYTSRELVTHLDKEKVKCRHCWNFRKFHVWNEIWSFSGGKYSIVTFRVMTLYNPVSG